MQTAKIIENGGGQAIRLPAEFRFEGDEVLVQKVGKSVLILPKNDQWETFLEGLGEFTEDYFEAVSKRNNELPRDRESL